MVSLLLTFIPFIGFTIVLFDFIVKLAFIGHFLALVLALYDFLALASN